MLAERLARVREAIAAACDRSGRKPGGIGIVAITKGHPVDVLLAALDAGLADVGENRVQEARAKFQAAGAPLGGARRHMVGSLQRNKVKEALGLFDWIQSVDSLRLAEEISTRAAGRAAPVDVLIEVNASGEERKRGFLAEQVADGLHAVAALPDLRVRGLMTMAPWTDDEAVLRRTFRAARRVFEAVNERGTVYLDTLSMGMSNDYPLAVEEGATMLRLGTALFGPRTL